MPNLRIIHNNIADRSSISASNSTNTVTLPASNMLNDYKGQVHRSAQVTAGQTVTVTYTLTWPVSQTIGGVVLPCTNLSSSSTILVQAYSDVTGTTQLNSGAVAVVAAPGTALTEWTSRGVAANSNIFSYGGVSKTSWWFAQQYTTVRNLKITLTDSGAGSPGYIDCSRIVCGGYWSPQYNVDRSGLVISVQDSSQVNRTDNGDLLAEQGFVYDQLSFNLGVMADTDRNTLVNVMRTVGTSKNILVSVFPQENNSQQEQIYTVYGKRENSDISYLFPGLSTHSIKIIGW